LLFFRSGVRHAKGRVAAREGRVGLCARRGLPGLLEQLIPHHNANDSHDLREIEPFPIGTHRDLIVPVCVVLLQVAHYFMLGMVEAELLNLPGIHGGDFFPETEGMVSR